MGKMMISLSDEIEEKIRKHIKKEYHGRVGGMSIFFEVLIREYFNHNNRKARKENDKTKMSTLP